MLFKAKLIKTQNIIDKNCFMYYSYSNDLAIFRGKNMNNRYQTNMSNEEAQQELEQILKFLETGKITTNEKYFKVQQLLNICFSQVTYPEERYRNIRSTIEKRSKKSSKENVTKIKKSISRIGIFIICLALG